MVGGVFIASISQLLLKKSADKVKPEDSFLSQYMNMYVLVGYGLMFIAACIPFIAYRYIELKYGAVIESLGYIFIMILSAIFLKEKITARKLIGNSLIILGIVIFSTDFI
jgi:drug/metabolite transporter (DMT)-like permease